ncbi:MAG: hypothetical protein QM740_20095 [Acidovorax sp.]
MSIDATQEGLAYLAQADGTMALNNAGADAQARYRAARADQDWLERSLAGALLAGLFLQHPWLDAVTLTFQVSSEYDDSGGFYRSILLKARMARPVPGRLLPEEEFPESAFDADCAACLIEEVLEDCEFDLHTGLADYPEGYDELTVSLERSPVTALLQSSPVDGSLACIAWGLTLAS